MPTEGLGVCDMPTGRLESVPTPCKGLPDGPVERPGDWGAGSPRPALPKHSAGIPRACPRRPHHQPRRLPSRNTSHPSIPKHNARPRRSVIVSRTSEADGRTPKPDVRGPRSAAQLCGPRATEPRGPLPGSRSKCQSCRCGSAQGPMSVHRYQVSLKLSSKSVFIYFLFFFYF